jgi:hypothetical protein
MKHKMSRKDTKLLFEGWRRYLTEAEEPAAEGGAETAVHVYDFDGVLATFSPDLKQKFFEQSKAAGSKITGTEIQIKNTLALGASLLATAESVAENYVELAKPAEPYYIISKFSNPSYVLKLAYYDELRDFLEKNGLDLREAPNAAPTKKATVIKKYLDRVGAGVPAQVLIAGNTAEESKVAKAEAIPSKHKGQNVRYVVHGTDTTDGRKESTMMKNGLINAGAPEGKVEVMLISAG